MNTKPLHLKIHDLGLAAALISCGFELHTTDRDHGGRFYFVFSQSQSLTKAINAYWADKLNIKARTYFDNTKMLKGRIYAER